MAPNSLNSHNGAGRTVLFVNLFAIYLFVYLFTECAI